MKAFFCIFLSLIASNSLYSQRRSVNSLKQDSLFHIENKKDPFWKHVVPPAVFIGLSAITWPRNEDVKNFRNRYVPNFNNHLDDYMQYAPAATVFSLNIAGVKGRNKLGRAALNWGGAMLIMGGLVNTIKYSAKVMRPDGTSKNSFPSGHTATAFMNADFLHKEYGQVNSLYSILGYSMSSYTGLSRSLNNRHWLSDILAGAGIGILSTELSYLIIDSFYKNKGDYFTSFDTRTEIKNPSFVSVKFGQSFYLDNLMSLDNMGLEGAIEGAYFFNRKWGIGAELGFMHIPFEREAISSFGLDDLYLDEDIINPQIDMQSLGLTSLMIGGYYSKFIGSKFILQGKILTGISLGIGGDIDINGEEKNSIEHESVNIPLMEYTLNKALIVGAGTSFTAMIAPTLGISLYIDYKYTNPKAKVKISKYYLDVEDKFVANNRLPISALSGGLKITSYF